MGKRNKIKIFRHGYNGEWVLCTPTDVRFSLTCFEDCRRLAHLFASIPLPHLVMFEAALTDAVVGDRSKYNEWRWIKTPTNGKFRTVLWQPEDF